MAGLPKIQFLGLPDAVIKESVYRIQSSFKHCGYKLPRGKQIVVNLKPSYVKKNSRGLDLAIASAILWESGQVEKPKMNSVALYGELSLKGEVQVPDDFEDIIEPPSVDAFYTGYGLKSSSFGLYRMKHLNDLQVPEFLVGDELCCHIERPSLPEIKISKIQSELISLMAVGEHHTLLAGPPGTGKTTLAFLAAQLLKNPSVRQLRECQKISRYFGTPVSWRPIVHPHHTATALSMIGGGSSPRPGDITRAHGGSLIMDEFLEFDLRVSEALREPLETGKMTVSRTGNIQTYPASILLFATTNLCPCGYYVPERDFECRGRPRFCLSSIQKLSGPMLDRFHMVSLSHEWDTKNQNVKISDVLKHIEEVYRFIEKTRKQKIPNSMISTEYIDTSEVQELLPDFQDSFRRKNAFLRLAQTVADYHLSEKIKPSHIERAYQLSILNFNRLKNLG